MQIGKYTLGRLIGKGGAGSVYESLHPLLARPVAIKLMHTNDATARAEFLHEAQTVAALSHPNIINIFDVDEYQGQPFLVMELVERSFADLLVRGVLPFSEAVDMILPLLDGLTYAHSKGLIHCDLKPGNILLRTDQSPVLADFGLALKTRTKPGVLVGTPEYMAPEQFRGETLDARTDIYALGVLLYEALTGYLPFNGDIPTIIHGHLQVTPIAPSQHNPALNSQIDTLILQLLAKNPIYRPQTVAELETRLRQLRALSTNLPRMANNQTTPIISQSAPPKQSPTNLHAGVRQWWPLMIVLILIVAGAAVALLAQPARVASIAADTAETLALPTAIATTILPITEAKQISLRQLVTAPMVHAEQASNTSDFSIAGVTWEDDPTSILFVGEIRNEGSSTREHIRLQIELLDGEGQRLSIEDGVTERGYLAPGETTPFTLYFLNEAVPRVKFADYRILVDATNLSTHTSNYVIRDNLVLSIEKIDTSSFGNVPTIHGTFHNNNNAAVAFPEILVVFYNAAGDVIGVTYTFAETPGTENKLAAEASAPFKTNFVSLTQRDPVSFMIYAEASRPSQ